MKRDQIIATVRAWLVERLLGETTETLGENTPLLSSRRIDSLTLVELVEMLEAQYGIEIQPQAMDSASMDTLADIADLVLRMGQP